jgi:flagellar hook-associated protein 3 FlgL
MGTSAALLYQLQTQSDQQTALQTAATTAGHRMDTMQSALSSIATTLHTVASSAQSWTSGMPEGLGVIASQASHAMAQVAGLLNTSYAGGALFAGDTGTTPPMRSPNTSGGATDIAGDILARAVAAKGGALSTVDIDSLVNGTDGLASVFDDTNSDPAKRYTGAIYAGSTDGKPTTVLIGANQTVQYNASADQPAFRDMMQGLSMLSLLGAPSSQLDGTAKATLLSAATTKLLAGEKALTGLQGTLGTVQAQVNAAVETQKSAATATQAQILSYVQADLYGDSSKLTQLQTQLQASFAMTARLSQLSLVQYMS